MAKRRSKHKNGNKTTTTSPAVAAASSSSSKTVDDADLNSKMEDDAFSFARLQKPRPLSRGVLDYVNAQGFARMTPVQAATIPQFLSHKDVAVQAVTGSGKTLAFVIPVVEMLMEKKFLPAEIGALILSPTRELAQQTHSVARDLCRHLRGQPEPLLLTGGGSSSSSSGGNTRPVTADLQNFQRLGSNLVVGTPGRVDDILSRYAVIDCSELEVLVLDEADVLLNMGFSNTLQSILSCLPKMRRTALFSATQSSSTSSTLSEWMQRVGMRNPVWIDVAVTLPCFDAAANNNEAADSEPRQEMQQKLQQQQLPRKQQATPSSLTNYYVVTKLDEKLSRLAAFLQQHSNEKMIVFFLTCACVDFYGHAFQILYPHLCIELLHGKMVQKRREKTMERYRSSSSSSSSNNNNKSNDNKKGGALFCTDVAARGLDVTDVQWVIQVDAPQDPAFFVHRVGRSARAGKTGKSLLFLTPKEEAYIDLLQRRNVPLLPLPTSERCCPPEVSDDADESKEDKKKPSTKDPESHSKAGVGNRRNKIRCSSIRSAADPDLELDDVLPRIRDVVLKDRDMLEKGTKAFTSYVRAYKEHRCAFIFRFASLDLGVLATSFCLLRLPKMPELRDVLQRHKGRLPRFTSAGPDVDIFAIPYVDKARERARQKRLKEELSSGGKNAKLIKAERKKMEKEQKEKERRQKAVVKGRNPDKKRGRQARIVDEWDDLAKEERLVKKLRRGKITKEQFDQQMGEV